MSNSTSSAAAGLTSPRRRSVNEEARHVTVPLKVLLLQWDDAGNDR